MLLERQRRLKTPFRLAVKKVDEKFGEFKFGGSKMISLAECCSALPVPWVLANAIWLPNSGSQPLATLQSEIKFEFTFFSQVKLGAQASGSEFQSLKLRYFANFFYSKQVTKLRIANFAGKSLDYSKHERQVASALLRLTASLHMTITSRFEISWSF